MKRVVVVPCYNEAARLDVDRLLDLPRAGVDLILVDDGSRDATRTLLDDIARRDSAHVSVLGLDVNRGKGEAVRAGLRQARTNGADIVGYLDADLSTPPREMVRILDVIAAQSNVDVALGSRIRTLGRQIERRAIRHYLGRVFGTAASLVLRTAIYDTQCGAKAFRGTAALDDALSEPFTSRWVFDVELLARLLDHIDEGRFVEVPLDEWRDVRGGSLGPTAMAHAAVDLAKIALRRGR